MLEFNTAPLDVLLIGGTGAISASCARLAVNCGMRVTVLNRGQSNARRPLPSSVRVLTADIGDEQTVATAVGTQRFDAVVEFVSFGPEDAERAVRLFGRRARQYVQISSASVYGKPIRLRRLRSRPRRTTSSSSIRERSCGQRRLSQPLITRAISPERSLDRRTPTTTSSPPAFGGWGIFDRIERGAEIPVHGDGTSLWTLTHAEDFAVGLVGLLGNPRTLGETFNIVGDEVLSWNEIYDIMGYAVGRPAQLVHVPSELYRLVDPGWWVSDFVLGDMSHSLVFDNSKIKCFVPDFAHRRRFDRAVYRMLAWRGEHPQVTQGDPAENAKLDRLVAAYRASAAALTPMPPEPERLTAGG